MIVTIRLVESVFSSKFDECTFACIIIVILQHIGITAVTQSPVCALLKPRVSLEIKRKSLPRINVLKVNTNHKVKINVHRKKNQNTRCI